MGNANPLGRILNHDPKSRAYAADRPAGPRLKPVQRSVRHAMNAPHVDQFYTSGCVGFSGTNLLNCAAAVRSRRRWNAVFRNPPQRAQRYLDNNDGLNNYSGATENDPFPWTFPPTDEGSSAIGLMKYWAKYQVITGYDWCFTFDQFLAALQRQPVLVGTEWFEDMMTPDRLGRIEPTGKSVGGHEYLATQINWKTKYVGFENSWGENWGIGGRFYMHMDYIHDLLGDDGDACVARLL